MSLGDRRGETHVSTETATIDPTSKEGVDSIDRDRFGALVSQTLIMGARRPKPSHHASTIAEVAPGTMLAAWFGGAFEGKPDVGIYTARYEEGKWQPPQLVVPPKVGYYILGAASDPARPVDGPTASDRA